jgi:hypothetical protein
VAISPLTDAVAWMNEGEAGGADHPNGNLSPIPPDAAKGYFERRNIDAMDDTRTDDLIRRNHELLAPAAQAWSDFMETVARIDRESAQEWTWRALWHGWPKASRDCSIHESP